jgi:hypothetical protein
LKWDWLVPSTSFHSFFQNCFSHHSSSALPVSFTVIFLYSYILRAGYWWLTPVILAAWEAETQRIAVWGK